MDKDCTVSLSKEQLMVLMKSLTLALAQQRHKLGRIYSGEVSLPGGENALYEMEKEIDSIKAIEAYIAENASWNYENELAAGYSNDMNVIYVSSRVYERIKNNPDEIVVESQCQAPLYLKVVGVGK